MLVNLYIFKVRREFVEDAHDTRYIVRVHQFGTPKSKWHGVGSLVELYYELRSAFGGLEWDEIESSLEDKGGFELEREIEEFSFHQLFAKWS
jgi:hypothetical protein